jgi:tetratricopeptide (TPR) repeat protein
VDLCEPPRDLRPLEHELRLAERAREQLDWKHALHHYVAALALDAFSKHALRAIRRLHAEHDLLHELAGDAFAGAHLARAYLLADQGELDEALALVAQVDEALPELGLTRLMSEWLDRGPVSAESRVCIACRLAGATQVGLGRLRLLPGERASVEPYAVLAEKIISDDRPQVLAMASGVLRRAGRYDEAIRAAERAVQVDPDAGLVPLALAHRGAGRADRAAELFGELYTRSKDPAHLLEKARALGDGGRFREAIEALRRSLSLSGAEPDSETVLFAEWLEACASGDETALARDYDWVRRSALLHGTILAMVDASTNSLDNFPRGSSVKISVSCLESPSARMCLAVHQGIGPDPRVVEYSFGDVPSPDPRVPRAEVTTLLWREVGGVMVQAVAPPPPDIQELVADLAGVATDLFTCWDEAGPMASRAAGRLEQLAHAMVHPTYPAHEEIPTASWVYRYQVAAACLIARAEPGWSGTKRRQLLLDLVHGPMDWTTAAAVLVLGEIAVREPEALTEIRRELIELAKAMPTPGHCPHGTTLAIVAQKIPFFQPDVAQKLANDWLSSNEGDDADDDDGDADDGDAEATADPAPEPAEPDKKPWWKLW